MSTWQLQDAKNKFSEVVRRAEIEGPQIVTKHGKEAVVVVSAKDYEETGKAKPKKNFIEHLLSIPKLAEDEAFDFGRTDEPGRDVDF